MKMHRDRRLRGSYYSFQDNIKNFLEVWVSDKGERRIVRLSWNSEVDKVIEALNMLPKEDTPR